MSEQVVKEVFAAWNSHDGSRLAAVMADDGVYEDVALGRTMRGEEIADFIGETHTMSSDYVIEMTSVVIDGDHYAAEWTMSGTNDGPAKQLGLPATGKKWEFRGMSSGEIGDDERVKLHRDYWNVATFLMQIGVLPPPPGAQPQAAAAQA